MSRRDKKYNDVIISTEKIPGVEFAPLDRPLFIDGRPHCSDVRQRHLDNCFFLSVLKSLVLRNPHFIMQELIQDQDDKTVRVRLFKLERSRDSNAYHPIPIYYTIDKTVVKNAKHNAHQATWVDLLEKAYVLHRLDVEKSSDFDRSTYSGILDGGHPHIVYEHILGCESSSHMVSYLKESEAWVLINSQDVQNYFILKENEYEGGFAPGTAQRFLKEVIFDPDALRQSLSVFQNEYLLNDFLAHFSEDRYARYYELLRDYLDRDHINNAVFEKEMRGVLNALQPAHVDLFIEGVIAIKNKEDTYQILFNALQAGELICANTISCGPLTQGLVNGHAYHVINVYQRENGQRFVQLDNPWGMGAPSLRYDAELGQRVQSAITYDPVNQAHIDNNPSTFELPFETFISNFYSMDMTELKRSSQAAMHDMREAQARLDHEVGRLECAAGAGMPDPEDLVAHIQLVTAIDDVVTRQAVNVTNQLLIRAALTPAVTEIDANKHLLDQVKTNLDVYLNRFNQKEYDERGTWNRFTHRLTKKGADRYISQERRDRAHCVLALIQAYEKVSIGQDKNAVLGMLNSIVQRHARRHNKLNGFYGNRLGDALNPLNQLTINHTFQPYLSSIDAEYVIAAELKKQGFSASRSTGMQELDSMIRYYESYCLVKSKPSIAKNSSSLFAHTTLQESVRPFSISQDAVDVTERCIGSAFD